jgi:hypothetical protein
MQVTYHNRNTTTLEKLFTSYVTCLATNLYLGMTGQYVTADMIGTQETVNQLTRKLERHGINLCMDNFFSSLNLFNDLTNRKSTAPQDT